jgi:uncharacterized protein
VVAISRTGKCCSTGVFLALTYSEGKGVPQDYKETVKWYRLAAEQRNRFAQYNLGVMYNKGEGVPQDYQEAVKWFRLAAEQGHVTSQYNLGLRYYHGQGVVQDYVLAHMWFNLSGSSGLEVAVENRNIVEKNMTPSQIEKAQEMARNWKPKK